ncbi:MAG: dihydroxy-acid dehydratase domain-containing protein, partial [Burkholderiales bacterium]
SAAIPAVMAERMRNAEATGARAVGLAKDRLTPDKIMTADALENALRVLLAIGGSTNAIVHLTAMAGRLGIGIDLDAFDRMGRETPVLVDLKPTGQHYMEDLYNAGGLATILRELQPLLHGDALTVTGRSLREELADARPPSDQTVVHTLADPVFREGGIAVLRGNLAPDGAIIKQSAASEKLMQHTGRAVVFDSLEDLAARIDDDALDVKADDILVLKNAGPKGAPGMPEAGYLPIPRKLAQAGVKDMVRISDARMSGTAFGSIVLHVSPESAVGGPLALVRSGDLIRLDVAKRSLELLVDQAELAARRSTWKGPAASNEDARGYRKLFMQTVQQAHEGCDFDFLAREVTMRIPRAR